ncbi:putative ubiquinone/menaquinone biosynthesis methyltransferase [Rhodococcus sp. AW25M09]|uniref:class I SAM-dependent methyltransferase n=1 Tax=Rhodococcus sp. AW25M09 TaxID=1268303 RepID=UPI0002AC5288|nr:class I SAM-dependent methyltransferase [Rhodococcus sp. AW25M09]CCQ15097.1 putative ubiquinone/menaquinone biosynthesis methyltransferase [Rhodococcus sp. AW25M09]
MTAASLAATFNATSREFDTLTTQVWGPAGQSLAYALEFASGDAVLDVCCGTGASAIPAAAAVGPDGIVHAIDLADDLLEVGRAKATDRALRNIDFVLADATQWETPSTIPDAGYDALACSYGIFFLPDPEGNFARLVSLVRPGGRVGVTVWRKGAIEAFSRTYFEVIAAHSPPSEHSGPLAQDGYDKHPIRRMETVDLLGAWLRGAGAIDVRVVELANHAPATETFVWNLVLGSAMRGALTPFDDATRADIRAELSALLTERGIDSIDLGTLVATGVRAP